MALTTTTNSSAIAVTDTSIVVASASGFAAGSLVRVDDEFMQVTQTYLSGLTIPVLRGRVGTQTAAHNVTSNVVVGTGADFATGDAQQAVPYQFARIRRIVQYSASGAITLPVPGEDMVAVLVGTSALAMTIASPTKDMDGDRLTVITNAKSASTVTVNSGTVGVGNAGSGYDVLTAQNAGNLGIEFMACNGFWNLIGAPITGTSTALSWAIA